MPGAGADLLVRDRWAAGVCLGALGRYTEAFDVLRPLLETDSLAASARASQLRQLGLHAEAEELDVRALALMSSTEPDWRPAAYADATAGLVADAVGRHDVALARDRLGPAAEAAGAAEGTPHGWRADVRLAWVAAETCLLAGTPAEAVQHGRRALDRSAQQDAPRHLAKSTLFLGVCEHVAGDHETAAVRLSSAITLAVGYGLRPLLSVAYQMRAVATDALLLTGGRSDEALLRRRAVADAEAWRTTMRATASGLPGPERTAFLARSGVTDRQEAD